VVRERVDRVRAGATLEEVLYLPEAKVLKRMSLGYEGLLADIYWTRAVQYFGSKHFQHAAHYDLLAPLLDVTTELDPHLLVVYQFGSIFLSQRPPEGAGQPQKAIELVERGIRENPAEWRLYYNLGWIEYDGKDYRAAARAFEQGAKVPGSPPAMQVLAATTAQHAGEVPTSRLLWSQIYATTADKMIRANAIKHLEALQVDEDIARLEGGVEAYKQATGSYPASWAELEAAGWRGRLIDPVGYYYILKAGGRIEVQDPDRLPFISRGLPPGREAFSLTPEQRKAIRDAGSN
jgi:tetratricopeptide (TPR) repeat protein